MPSGVVVDSLTTAQHPYASQINTFVKNQASYSGTFTPTGLARSEYLRIIESVVRAMKTYQNSSGQIVDPIRAREFQYSTPCYAYAVSVLFSSGYCKDTALLSSGMRAMDAGIQHMDNDDVPDGHGDFCTVPLMLAYWNYKNVPGASSKLATWRTNLGSFSTSAVYNNSAPNWICINMTGEYLRYLEGLTTLTYVTDRIQFQTTRLDPEGLYQDSNTPETLSVTNTDGYSFAYDNVARSYLDLLAVNNYAGSYYQELQKRLWKGAWTGLLYQSPFGEVPTGMRSSHHFWNEASAAVNYEVWAAQYALAGKPAIAGAFKRAAKLSLQCVGSWLRPDGSGYVTKARYPISAGWGYMSYSAQTNYNLFCAAALAMAYQNCDSTIAEAAAPCDLGGYVLPVTLGFKKIFANAGGSYVEYDMRGDHAHNVTGLIRLHLKSSYPQLGPSDGAVGQVIAGAQYWPIYNETDPANLTNLSVGPSYIDSTGSYYPMAELQQIPAITTLLQTTAKSSFRVAYSIYGGATLYETVTVEPQGVTVLDSIVGGSHSSIRVNYPLLITDGVDTTVVTISGNQLIGQLKGKGIQFKVLRPSSAAVTRTGYIRNHRNGKCERMYATVSGRVAEYYVSAWPEYVPTSVMVPSPQKTKSSVIMHNRFSTADFALPGNAAGPYTLAIYSVQGRMIVKYSGTIAGGTMSVPENQLRTGSGVYHAVVTYKNIRAERQCVIVK